MLSSTPYTGNLRTYQEDGSTWLEDRPRSILADEYGLGKTRQAIAVLARHLPALVVAPAYLTRQWFDALCEQLPEATVSMPAGTRIQRALELAEPCDVRVVGYPMLAGHADTLRPEDYQTAIFDEGHRLRRKGATQTIAAREMAWRIPRVHMLTATPFYKADEDIWHLLHILDPDRFGSYWNFIRDWYSVNWAANYAPKIYGIATSKRHMFDRVLSEYMLLRTYQDVGRQLPPLIEKVIGADLQPEIRKHYKKLRKDWQLAGLPIESVGSVYYLLRQLTLAPKLPIVADIVDSIPKDQILIFTWYKESAHTVHNHLKRGTKHEVDALLLDGDTPPEKRADALIEQKRTGYPKIIIATIEALQEGANLEHIRHVIYAEETYVKGKHNQTLARALRDRNDDALIDEPVIAYYVRTRKTVDERIPIIRNSRGNAGNRELAQELLNDG